jgi:uncharacterized protein (DUF58 family)
MPTTRGWAAVGAGSALAVLWIAIGERLLLAVAIFLIAAVVIGSLYVRSAAPRVELTRRLTPLQVHEGDRAVVEVAVVAQRRLYQVSVVDVVQDLGSARFVADQVEPSDPLLARYEVLCKPRGIYIVGPAQVNVRDPLALAESGDTAGTADRLVVYPAVEDLEGMPIGRGKDPTVNTSRATFTQAGGEDFFTLREYQLGDDLRRVHWPSSAKRDELMIRQLEVPWQSRALIILDPRMNVHSSAAGYEHAVKGAASALRHIFRAGYTPTLWTGANTGTVVTSSDAYAAAMEELATVQPGPDGDLRSAVARLRRDGMSGGVLVMVTGVPDQIALDVYRSLGKDFYRTVVMSVGDEKAPEIQQLSRVGVTTVVSGPSSSWAPAWREGVERTWSTATAG